ncbi:phospholipase D family protein [Oceanomicrobium pacificus]|uniref:Phospholipase D n=1 Tax=Oceanomicrobium pacificus TaxID=2692916 RepID=A0A6B0TQ74_9RHOB|nr:phospholipase D family protein [Oceanomicrobium pacificus]MXU66096.1 hypothetical protein [Oceanomicrobium pacificus]
MTRFNGIRAAFAALSLLAMGACTYVPFDAPRTVSRATDPLGPSALASEAQADLAPYGGRSAFVPLSEGNDALGARLKMIEAAERSIDLQYFLIKPDLAGSLVSRALIDAAERGVRVRFLLDDVFTTADDTQLALLDSFDNIEVRLFNPLSRNSIKAVNFLLDFNRVNRRMHNKSLTVDNALSVVGGRNIADEYFQIHTDAEFADFDMFVAGPAVQKITESFDRFWNDPRAVPVVNIVGADTEAELRATLADITTSASAAERGIYRRAVNSQYIADFSAGRLDALVSANMVVSDSPDKLRQPVPSADRRLYRALQDQMLKSEDSVLILTPYFVPRQSGVDFYAELERRGIDVKVVTNSLAATNHSYVHGGYAKYRKALLEAGVQLYEVRADAPQVLGDLPEGSDVKLTMHTKLAFFDDDRAFVGSLNFDPRSIEINSELGLFVALPADSELTADLIRQRLADYAYEVRLDAEGRLIWVYDNGRRRELLRSEPGAGALSKFVAGVTRILPVEGQL